MSELSETITHQRQTLTCSYHAIAKVIVQNVFQSISPKEVDAALYTKNQCNKYLDDEVFKSSIAKLTPEECSPGGYERILQFLYVYYLISETHKICEGEKYVHKGKEYPVGTEKPVNSREIKRALSQMWENKIPRYFESLPHSRLVEMVDEVNVAKEIMGIKYIVRNYYLHQSLMTKADFSKIFENIQKSIRKGFYLYLGLRQEKEEDEDEHGYHAVHVVATFRNKLVIKNSWGDGLYEMDIDGEVNLKGRVYKIYLVTFLLPVNRFATSGDFDVGKPLNKSQVTLNGDKVNLNGDKLTAEMNGLGELIDAIQSRSRGKELQFSIKVVRGDAVSTNKGVGIFQDYLHDTYTLFPNIYVDGKVARVDVRTVPDALQLLTSLVEKDKEALEHASHKNNHEHGKKLKENLENSLLALENAKAQFALPSSSSITLADSAISFMSIQKEWRDAAPKFKRGDAVTTHQGCGIFMNYVSDISKQDGVRLFPGLIVRGSVQPTDVRTVPNALEMLTSLVEDDKGIVDKDKQIIDKRDPKFSKSYFEIGLGKQRKENLENSLLALKNAQSLFASSSSAQLEEAGSAVAFTRGEAIRSNEDLGIFQEHSGEEITMLQMIKGKVNSKAVKLSQVRRVGINSVPNGIEILKWLVDEDRKKIPQSTPENEPFRHYKRNAKYSTSMLERYLQSNATRAPSASSSSSSASSSSSGGSTKKSSSPKNKTRRLRTNRESNPGCRIQSPE